MPRRRQPPPGPPDPGEVAGSRAIDLTSADGARLVAHEATPRAPRGQRIVLLPDVRGLHAYYKDLAVRFAEAGFPTVAIDYFGRTAPDDVRDETFEHPPHVQQVQPAQVRDDVAAAIAHLDGFSDGPVFTVGFCFGGSQSWRLAASDLPLAGTIGFYGRPSLVEDVVPAIDKPMLLLVAGDDAATSPEVADRFAGQLEAAGVVFERQVYEGAPHSFFDRSYAQWQDACTDAWQRILSFTARHAATA